MIFCGHLYVVGRRDNDDEDDSTATRRDETEPDGRPRSTDTPETTRTA